MKRLYSLILIIFLIPVFLISAQEDTGEVAPDAIENAGAGFTLGSGNGIDNIAAAGDEDDNDEAEEENPEISYIEMDIRTSSLVELAAWSRELGLSEGGSRDDLASRLRNYYKIPPPQGRSTSTEQRIITIESARTTEYFTLDVVDEEYARLRGDVIVSLKDGSATHRIKAWEILYNRTRNVMTASGNVEYVREDVGSIETFKGESITVNLDNWSSIFLDGASTKSGGANTSAYRFAGTVISRNDEEVTVLSGADITNPNNEEAFWSIYASKLWLLPGNDWAVLNAVLKVGNIPVLYIPFFFYPADEIVFHPVLGTRTREGTFLQTTTYILGRPTASTTSENSITKIFGSASDDMEKKREGVFLRSTGEKRQDPNSVRLKLLFDAYVNMGMFLGTELDLPQKGVLGATKYSIGFGLTRNIYYNGSENTPFATPDGDSDWNRAMFFSTDFPLRYRFNFDVPFNFKYGSLKLELPFYSDPYVDRDFMRRTEVLDWLTTIKDVISGSPDEESRDTSLSSYAWRLTGSFRPSVTGFNPYISSLSVSSFSSSLEFTVRNSTMYDSGIINAKPNTLPNPASPPNPGKSFFFPNRFTMFSVSAGMSGTPYNSNSAQRQQPRQDARAAEPAPGDSAPDADNPLPEFPISPWELPPSDEAGEQGPVNIASVYRGFDEESGGGGFFPEDIYSLTLPALSQKFDLATTSWGPGFNVDYNLSPSMASELQFMTTGWKEQEDIDWGDVSSILSRFRSTASVGLNLTHPNGNAYSGSFRLSGTGSWQDYMLLNEDAEEFNTEAKVKAARDRAYRETFFTSSWELNTMVKPFFQNSVWGNTNLQYRLGGLLAKTEVDITGKDPEWDWVLGKWEKADIGTHDISANFAANVMDYNQNINISAALPPKDASITGNATARAWISETSVSTKVLEPFDDEKRKFDPLAITETLKFGTIGSFQQTARYNIEDERWTNFHSNLNLSKIGLTASLLATYAKHYSADPNFFSPNPSLNLWKQHDYESLEFTQFTLSYTNKFAKNDLWGKRLSFSTDIGTSLNFNLQQYTSSSMDFRLGFTTRIVNFLELNFTTNSANAVMFRYFENTPFFDLPGEVYKGQEKNFFIDLYNSFRFDDDDLRRQSGFKLKSLNVSLTHFLGDWHAKLTVTMRPFRPVGERSFEFRNDVSFLVQWIPIGEIKTEIDYKDDYLSIR